MKYVLLITFLLCSLFTMKAQSYILVDDGMKLRLCYFHMDSKGNFDYYDNIKCNLVDIYGSRFVGYNWKGDSLVLFLETKGKVIQKTVLLDSIKSVPILPILKASNLKALYYGRQKDPNAEYRLGNLKIQINTHGWVECYREDSLLWQKHPNISSFGIGTLGLGYQNPVITPDGQTLLLRYATYFTCYLVEIDVNTGKQRKIVRNKIYTPFWYSPDGRYILYTSKRGLRIYDRETRKKFKDFGWRDAFWLYR
ncbi:TolB family protein [Odoribacter laneus]|uniref:TolB family protein n=1 Tax=Odoribacter laneus TaxID=626933 RepID=UPI0023EFA1CC|nr:hypothetical protein [Odoribacter laneus]